MEDEKGVKKQIFRSLNVAYKGLMVFTEDRKIRITSLTTNAVKIARKIGLASRSP